MPPNLLYYIQLYTLVYMNMDNNKPFPIRLGVKKAILRKEASENDRSLHYWINKILNEYLLSKKNKK